MTDRDDIRRDLEVTAETLVQVCALLRDHVGPDELAFLAEQQVMNDPDLTGLQRAVTRALIRAVATGKGVTEAIEVALDACELEPDAKLN